MLKQLRYFQSVVRLNSFSEAAEKNFISQSAISQQIQDEQAVCFLSYADLSGWKDHGRLYGHASGERRRGKCFTISPLGLSGFTSIRAGGRAG